MPLRVCDACGKYTMAPACPACSAATREPGPPKFSPEDKYGVYRRRLKRMDEEKRAAASRAANEEE